VLSKSKSVSWPGEKLLPAHSEPEVPVVLISSEKYALYTSVTLFSLLQNRSSERFYDIIILFSEMSEESKQRLCLLAEGKENVTIRLCHVKNCLTSKKLDISGVPHTGVETYLRLLIPDIFCSFERLIYLDSDLVVCADIGNLHGINMPDSVYIAGVPDIDIVGQYYSEPKSGKYYFNKILGLNTIEDYLQTGVLLLKPGKIHEQFPGFSLMQLAMDSRMKYADQDILNIAFLGETLHIDMRWNVVNDCGGFRVSEIVSRAPTNLQAEYMRARDNPWIVHYSGYEKPWDCPNTDMAGYFHSYAKTLGLSLPINLGMIKQKNPFKWIKKTIRRICPRGSYASDAFKLILFMLRYRRPNNRKIKRAETEK